MDRKKIITAAGTTAAVFAILAAGGTSPSDAASVDMGSRASRGAADRRDKAPGQHDWRFRRATRILFQRKNSR